MTPLSIRARTAQVNAESAGWTLTAHLGSGGYAEVYAAKHEDGRVAAIKLFRHPGYALTEAMILQRLGSHPGIVEYIAHGGQWYAMTRVDGVNALSASVAGMPEGEAVSVAVDVGSALSHCHAQGVIHGDVKPTNVILAPDMAVLVDFGLASDSGNLGGAANGTPGFVSPEVLNDEPADERADIYALGCLLHALVWGYSPFAVCADTPVQVLRAQLKDKPELKISGRLGEVVRKACEFEPDKRFQSVAEMVAALQEIEIDSK